MTAPINLGFLSRTNARNLAPLIEHHNKYIDSTQFEEIPADEELIAKYLSALLVIPPRAYSEPILALLRATTRPNKMLKIEEERLHELIALNHSYKSSPIQSC